MVRDSHNIIPVTFALVLHVLIFGSLFVALDLRRPTPPPVPLAMTATLVTDSEPVSPPVERLPEPTPEPEATEPEPEVVEPEVIEPDPVEEARKLAEEQKRLEDQLREEQRLQRIEDEKAEAERKRQAELEEKRKAELEAKRKAEAEAEQERRRKEAEEQRQRDIERQREENRREEERLLEQARNNEISAESERLQMMNSNEMLAYQAAMQQKVVRNWVRPATAPDNLECFVVVQQLPNGEVTRVQVRQCNGDEVVIRSIEAAVRRASPLPLPSNPILFLRDFEFRFTIRD